MRSRITRALAFAASTAVLASPALAQGGGPSGVHLMSGQWAVDGSIGFAIPLGDYGTNLSTGLDLMGAIEYHPPGTGPFYFRGEVGYSHFGANCGFADCGSSSILRFNVDGLYDFPLENTKLNVYGLAGIGLYHVSATASSDVCDPAFANCSISSTGFGLNLGAGLRYPVNPIQLFFELRYQLPLTGLGNLGSSPFFPFQFGARYIIP